MQRAFFEILKGKLAAAGPPLIPLVGLQSIGTRATATLRFTDTLLANLHASVEQTPDGWELVDTSGRHLGTRVNGQRISRAWLKDGDEVALGNVRLRVRLEVPPERRDAAIEDAVAEDPGNAAAVQVYADWLVERGDPLGERLRGLRPDDAEALGPLEKFVARGDVVLEWRHGLIHRARLSNVTDPKLSELLAWLLPIPSARFMTSLEIDVLTFARWRTNPADTSVLADTLDEIQRALSDAPLPALRTLRLGPIFDVGLRKNAAQVVHPRRAPRLAPPGPHGYLELFGEAWLEIESTTAELTAEGFSLGRRLPLVFMEPNIFAAGPAAPVEPVGEREDAGEPDDEGEDEDLDEEALEDFDPEAVGDGDEFMFDEVPDERRRRERCLAIFEWLPGWEVAGALRVNGAPAARSQRVVPGDLIELGRRGIPELTVRLSAASTSK